MTVKIHPEQLFIALDTSDAEAALVLAKTFAPTGVGLKLGLEFYSRYGGAGIAPFCALGVPIFLDLKLHDIPNTVAAAVKNIAALGVQYLTVHSSGGTAMLKAAVEAAGSTLNILAVTILTSLDAAALQAIGLSGTAEQAVLRLAGLAAQSGCAGIVCSPQEVAAVRTMYGTRLRYVTPGIRPLGSDKADQMRTATPGEALSSGADFLVIGRPITGAKNPLEALKILIN